MNFNMPGKNIPAYPLLIWDQVRLGFLTVFAVLSSKSSKDSLTIIIKRLSLSIAMRANEPQALQASISPVDFLKSYRFIVLAQALSYGAISPRQNGLLPYPLTDSGISLVNRPGKDWYSCRSLSSCAYPSTMAIPWSFLDGGPWMLPHRHGIPNAWRAEHRTRSGTMEKSG